MTEPTAFSGGMYRFYRAEMTDGENAPPPKDRHRVRRIGGNRIIRNAVL